MFGTLFSKGNITIIENISKVGFEKQERSIANLSANLKIPMDEMKKLRKEITDLKQSLASTENVLNEKVKKLDEKYVNLENKCNELYNNSLESEYFYNKLVGLEDRSRTNNLGINKIAKGSNESWEQSKEQL